MGRTRVFVRALLAGIPLVASVAMFRGILRSDFFLDDFVHLYDLTNYGYLRLVLTPHGGHSLPTSNSAYFLLYHVFGLVPRRWFLVVLLTHGVNALLLFRLVRWLTRRSLLAAALATLWGIAPTCLASLSWFAVYGHVLVATFMLWLLGDMVRLATIGGRPTVIDQTRWVILSLCAATSFGMGLGMSLALPAVALLALADGGRRKGVALLFAGCVVVLVAFYLGQRLAYAHWWPNHPIPLDPSATVLSGFASDPLRFIGLVVVLLVDGIGYGASSLLLGPLSPTARASWAGANPLHVVRVVAAVLFALSVVSGWRGPARQRRFQIAMYLLIASCYAPTAVVVASRILSYRAILGPRMDTVLPWAVTAMEPRYQYVVPALLAVTLGNWIAGAITRCPRSARPLVWAPVVWLVLVAPLSWRRRAALVVPPMQESSVAKMMDSFRATAHRFPGRDAFIENRPLVTWHDINLPGWAAVFVMSSAEDTLDGRRIHFVERDPELLRALKAERGRIGGLLVGEYPTEPDGEVPDGEDER